MTQTLSSRVLHGAGPLRMERHPIRVIATLVPRHRGERAQLASEEAIPRCIIEGWFAYVRSDRIRVIATPVPPVPSTRGEYSRGGGPTGSHSQLCHSRRQSPRDAPRRGLPPDAGTAAKHGTAHSATNDMILSHLHRIACAPTFSQRCAFYVDCGIMPPWDDDDANRNRHASTHPYQALPAPHRRGPGALAADPGLRPGQLRQDYRERQPAGNVPTPSARVLLDDGDVDLVLFPTYLLAATSAMLKAASLPPPTSPGRANDGWQRLQDRSIPPKGEV
jgi:hypothetical protein